MSLKTALNLRLGGQWQPCKRIPPMKQIWCFCWKENDIGEFGHFRIFLDTTQKLMERIKQDFQGRCAYKSLIYPDNLSPQFPIGGEQWVYVKRARVKKQVRGKT